MDNSKKRSTSYIIGKAILFASMQFAIGSVEMSSKFSVKNFSTSQDVLDNAMIALRDYLIVGFIWTLGTSLIFYSNYGTRGFIYNVVCNFLIMYWIYKTYMIAFKQSSVNNNLAVKNILKV